MDGHEPPMTSQGRPRYRFLPAILALWLAVCLGVPVRAIILFGTDDPARNTTAPTAAFANSGWQWVGTVGSALGTVIGPRHFISAQHLQLGGGSAIVFRGVTYHSVTKTNLAGTDLDVFTIQGRFPDHAPLCSSRREVGRPVVMIGRGGRRGAAYGTHGWFIGDYDGVQRWGTNTVEGTVAASSSNAGELLYMGFNSTAGADEGIFSAGDSGGPTFVLDRDNVWKLVGVNYAVDGPFAESLSDTPVMAAVYDARGLYLGYPGQQQLVPNGPTPVAARSFVSRISSHIDALNALITAAPAADAILLQWAATPDGTFVEEAAYAVDPVNRTIEVPRSADRRFYRARGINRLELFEVTTTTCRFRF